MTKGWKLSSGLPRQGWLRLMALIGAGLPALIALWLALRVNITLKREPQPQAILVLDGETHRLQRAVEFAQQQAELPLWISGNCSHRPEAQALFKLVPQYPQHLHVDLRATDTVTNFTTLVDDLVGRGIRHVYLVTSDYHMERAIAIATIVFGSHGVVITPVPQPSPQRPTEAESWQKLIRDGGRSLLWLATGYSGADLNPNTKHLPGGVSCRFQLGQ